MDAVKTSFLNSQQLPFVVEPKNQGLVLGQFLELLESQKKTFQTQLLKYGGILFRNFPVQTATDFSAVIKRLGLGEFVNYIGGDSPRTKIQGGVYTSTEAPPSIKIPLHNELSFVNKHPKHIYFFCDTPPKEKGETIIGDARKIYQAIDDGVKKRFIDKGLKYVSCYYYKSGLMEGLNKIQKSHKSWIDVFETDSKEEVASKCRAHDFELSWNKNDWLKISQKRPAIMSHPETEEKVWFNQVHLYDFNPKLLGWWRYVAAKMFYFRKHTRLHEVYFADEMSIPREDIYHVMDVLDSQTIYFPWQKGDVLVLDNVLTMHGRATFTGKRRILTALTS